MQMVRVRKNAVGLGSSELFVYAIELEIEFILVIYGSCPGRHRNQSLPAIRHQRRVAHLQKLAVHFYVRLDRVPLQTLLVALERDLDGVKIVRVTRLFGCGEIGERGLTTRQKQRQHQDRQNFL